ncbi:hypothetical protein CORC01_00492 [Colletotrichum orchidophilum]|uniref:Uncharacterized protein n=1 Tax=Colletotrichum orchidophilum TaxID=1209926 RepID=A0A1G4BS01_9PEZI|nr:uncharacterized protein CORC01_00492 [Colletotrichum orchidophilum]OHF04153.1 hypothetical protein CORC01_00492 [Colletotrichum orchidophilum]
MNSTDSIRNGSTSSKSSHKHSTAESNNAVSQRRISDYEKSSGHSNMYHIHNHDASAKASKAYHQKRMAQTLTDFDERFGSPLSRHA